MTDGGVILAVDTASEFGSIAVRRARQTLAEIHLHSPEGFAHVLFQSVERALKQANLTLGEIDCFAAASGPGSFTGVRVGLSAVKGLADALGKRAAGISSLRALSLAGTRPLRAVAMDARRGQVYAAVYGEHTKLIGEETVGEWDEWRRRLPANAELVVLRDGPWSAEKGIYTRAPQWQAESVALCAEMDGPEGWQDPIVLDANYVRRSDAELFWKDS